MSKEVGMYCCVIKDSIKFPVPMRLGEIPVPIPNTMVKPQAADNTILETVWEGRWVPGLQKSTTVVYIDWS